MHTLYHFCTMKTIQWNSEKSALLKETRGLSFEDILFFISEGGVVDDIAHPNSDKYPNQRILMVEIRGYVWAVPYVEEEEYLFFKTAVPSRKATKKYLGK